MGPRPVDVGVDALAVYRITRLLQVDSITEPLRAKVLARWGGHKYAALIDCPWCLSVWIAGGVLLARSVSPRTWDLIARAMAFSAVTGLITETVERMENGD